MLVIKIFSWLLLIVLLISCKKTIVNEEVFDSVHITEFRHSYDEHGRLSAVVIMKTTQGDAGAWVAVDYAGTHKYTYQSNTDYTIEEYSADGEKEITTHYTDMMEETLWLEAGKDTVKYLLTHFHNKDKENPKYRRSIYRFSGYPIDDFVINDNLEEIWYRNAAGECIRWDKYDFNTGEQRITYYFNHTPYQKAVKLVPPTNHKLEIICTAKSMSGDTIVEQVTINGALHGVTKTLCRGDRKEVYQSYANGSSPDNSIIEYVEDGVNIEVRLSTNEGSASVDSTYSKGGKEIRHMSILNKNKTITLSEYDSKGNLCKQIVKSKYSEDLFTNEDLDAIINKLKHKK